MTDSQFEVLSGRLNSIEQNISTLIQTTACKCDNDVVVSGLNQLNNTVNELSKAISEVNLEGISIQDDISTSKRLLDGLVTDLSSGIGSLKDQLIDSGNTARDISNLSLSTKETLNSVETKVGMDILEAAREVHELIGHADAAVSACNTQLEAINLQLNALSESNKNRAEQVAQSIDKSLAECNKSVLAHSNTLAVIDEITKRMKLDVASIEQSQKDSKQLFETFVANGKGYNAIYELMVAVNNKIATSYQTFIELATKVTSSQYEINAGTEGIVNATDKLITSVNDINDAVVLLKDFYPNLLESQHVCEHFSRVIPSLDKFNEVLDSMTDKKLKNVSFTEKVDFANMVANSVSAISESIATAKVAKGGNNW